MLNIDLSVIIPAYNAEQFVERAINSVLQQKIDHDKIEIIVVENGSTDNTTMVVERITKSMPCVKLFHSDKGVSNARNKGMQEANGKWLMFLDADDCLADGVTGDELPILKEDTDIYYYGHRNASGERTVCDNGIEEVFVDSDIELCKIKNLKNPTRYMQACVKIYRTEFLNKHKIMFDPQLRLSEDSEFVFRCLQVAQKVVFKNKIIYIAIPNNASATRAFDGKKLLDYMFALEKTRERVEKESAEVKNAFAFYVLMNMNVAMVREVFSVNNSNSFSQKYKTMCGAIKEPVFKRAIDEIEITDCTSVRMAAILCLKLGCKPLAAVVFWMRALQNHMREK